MRSFWRLIHRYAGLAIAGFLFFSGATGAVISWSDQIDSWLNPDLLYTTGSGPARSSYELARQIEARYPNVQVTEIPFLSDEPGRALEFGVSPRVDPATHKLYEPGFNSVYVDQATGHELGKRDAGAPWPITRRNLMSFLYVLHYSMHVPEMWGIDRWGVWLLGGVALVWALDCFVGLYLTLPVRRRDSSAPTSATAKSWWQRWKPAWKVRTGAGSYKLNFDLHRAFGLWTWVLLFFIAFTAVSLNLYREVFFPAMSLVSKVTPSPFDLRTPSGRHAPIEAAFGFERAMTLAKDAANQRDWHWPVSEISYAREYGIYRATFPRPEDGPDGVGGVGHRSIYIDALDGRILGDRRPWTGTASDIFVQAQFPVHSGRILGIPGRILSSLMGLVAATLSVTGVVIWWRRRASRSRSVSAGQAQDSTSEAASVTAVTAQAAFEVHRQSTSY